MSPDEPVLVEKLGQVVNALRADGFACECLLSLLSGAILSYRIDSVLRPFPPMFMVDGEKDINRLREALNHLPSLSDLHKQSRIDPDALDLLHWCFCSLPFKVSSSKGSDTGAADFLLQFVPSDQQERLFEEAQNSLNQPSPLVEAFHGTKLENAFSILNCGLLTHMNKVGIFGSGTYLTTEEHVALAFTNRGSVWPRSTLGSQLSCVVVCDVIANHPDVRWTENSNADKAKHGVPDKYILVKNNSVLRLKYLRLYATKGSRRQATSPAMTSIGNRTRLWSLAKNNMSAVVLLIYVAVLLCINLPSSRPLQRLWSTMYSNY